MDHRRSCPAIVDCQSDQNIVRGFLGILDLTIEVPVFVEGTCVGQFELRFQTRPRSVDIRETFVRKSRLRVFVDPFRVRTCGGRIDVIVRLLDVFAVVSLGSRKSVKPFFEDRIAGVPEGK
jgi:hypothetical protein